jgi:hypothetical protein
MDDHAPFVALSAQPTPTPLDLCLCALDARARVRYRGYGRGVRGGSIRRDLLVGGHLPIWESVFVQTTRNFKRGG